MQSDSSVLPWQCTFFLCSNFCWEFRLSKFSPCPQQERAQVLKRFPSTHFKKAAA